LTTAAKLEVRSAAKLAATDSCQVEAPWVALQVDVPVSHIEATLANPSAVQAAVELGRLDWISTLLAFVAVLTIFGGLFAFGYIRGQTQAVARAEADRIAERRLTALLSQIEERLNAAGVAQNKATQPVIDEPETGEVQEAEPDTEFRDRNEG
jgi:hypothetical protein